MNVTTPSYCFSDGSSCGDSPGPVTPVSSPFVHPFMPKDGAVPSIERFHNLDHKLCSTPFQNSRRNSATSPNVFKATIKTVCFIGAGYVGGPTAAIMALHNPEIRVEVVDKNQDRVQKWASRHLPIHEPGLNEIVRLCRDGANVRCRHPGFEDHTTVWKRQPNLFFTSDMSASIARSDIVFLAVNTSTKTFGIGKGQATDMSACDAAVKEIARNARPGTVIVEKSTVPCGTAQRIKSMLLSLRPGIEFEVLSNPEFMAEGSAIKDLMNPDRVIIGSFPTENGRIAMKHLVDLYAVWVPMARILTCNVWSSELSKLVANAMLAQRISSINSISAICEATGADIREIAQAVGYDSRIGPQFLQAGLGFGGSCFKKDICSLVYLSESLGLSEVAAYWTDVNRMNEYQYRRFARRLVTCLDNNLVGKKIAILGFAFKANTGDPRESLAAEVIKDLLEEHPSQIAIFDPYCRADDIRHELQDMSKEQLSSLNVMMDPYAACEHADAILIATDCEQFKSRSKQSMKNAVLRNTTSIPRDETVELDHDGDRYLYGLVSSPACNHDCTECIALGDSAIDGTSTHGALDWPRIISNMNIPRWIFDSRNVLDANEIQSYGIAVQLEFIGRRL